jgi:hypothetical protein
VENQTVPLPMKSPIFEEQENRQKLAKKWAIFGPPKKSKLSSRVSTPLFLDPLKITGLSGKYTDFLVRPAKMAKTVKKVKFPDFWQNRPFFDTF